MDLPDPADPAKLFGLPAPALAELPDALHIPYLQNGAGELMVLVHGSLCDFRYWKPQLAALSAHYRCITPSLPHYWPAVRPAEQHEFSWSRHVDQLADLITHLDASGAHVVGHSRGGCIAFHLAARYPHLVRTLTLADPGGPLQQGEAVQAQLPETVNTLRAKAAGLIGAGQVDEGLELFVDSVSRPGFWKKSTVEFRTMATDNAHTLALQFRDPLPAYSAQSASAIRCPTLLIDGEKSPRMFRKNAEALDQWIADARRATVVGASHGMNVAHPGAFNRYVLEFVRAAQG
jgi:pimeloyl-ACP methyl ester carboxylesterase